MLKALEKRPEMRYPTMDEFMRAMSDPVGFVEAHGGIQGFMQKQLMPSSAPLPPIRMTTAPMTTPMPTPAPGQLTPYGLHSPVPTTLGGAAGQQMPGRRSRLPLMIAAGLVVVGASAAIAFVVTLRHTNVPGKEPQGHPVDPFKAP